MVDRTFLVRTSWIAAVLCLLAAGVGLAADSAAMAGGIAFGGALGLTPFVSWSLLLRAARAKTWVVLLLVGKLGAYSAGLYFLVTKGVVRPLGVFLGMTAVILVWIAASIAYTVADSKVAR